MSKILATLSVIKATKIAIDVMVIVQAVKDAKQDGEFSQGEKAAIANMIIAFFRDLGVDIPMQVVPEEARSTEAQLLSSAHQLKTIALNSITSSLFNS